MKKVAHNLFRGKRPENLNQLKFNDIKCVISLQSGLNDVYEKDAYRLIHWPDTGIKHYELEQNDFAPPTKSDVEEFLKVVKLNIQFGKIYVHCKAGVDRTGFMIACYRMQIEGWSFNLAWKEMKKEGSHWWYRWWKYELQKYEVKR